MAYRVVSCQSCGAPRVVADGPRSAQCPACHARIDVSRALVHAEVATQEEARDALGQVNAQRAGGELVRAAPLRGVRPADEIDESIAKARGTRPEALRARLAAEGLTARLQGFGEDQWLDALGRLDVERARALEHLERLVAGNVVAEPRPGLYRYVG